MENRRGGVLGRVANTLLVTATVLKGLLLLSFPLVGAVSLYLSQTPTLHQRLGIKREG